MIESMSAEDLGLFEVHPPDRPQSDSRPEQPITETQVEALRNAFTSAGIDSMDERKAIIESCTIREVANIRELYAKDVRPILRRIEERQNSKGPVIGSAWDNREEDTWIDRL